MKYLVFLILLVSSISVRAGIIASPAAGMACGDGFEATFYDWVDWADEVNPWVGGRPLRCLDQGVEPVFTLGLAMRRQDQGAFNFDHIELMGNCDFNPLEGEETCIVSEVAIQGFASGTMLFENFFTNTWTPSWLSVDLSYQDIDELRIFGSSADVYYYRDLRLSANDVAAVPEPNSLFLMFCCVVMLLLLRRIKTSPLPRSQVL